MKRFQFTLEAVQTVRERAARAALEDYARSLRRRLECEAALEKADRALARHLTEWRGAMEKGFGPHDMLQHQHLRMMLELHRSECAKVLKEAADAAAKAQSTFQFARRKSDVVERFHERQRNDFNLAVLKEEQHLLDELASSRHDAAFLEKGAVHA